MFISFACIILTWQWIQVFDPGEWGYTASHPLRRGLYNFSCPTRWWQVFVHREEGYRHFHPSRQGLFNFSSINKRVTSFCLFEKRVSTLCHPSNFHPLRRGLYKFSSIEERVTNLSSIKFSSIEKSVTQLFIIVQSSISNTFRMYCSLTS